MFSPKKLGVHMHPVHPPSDGPVVFRFVRHCTVQILELQIFILAVIKMKILTKNKTDKFKEESLSSAISNDLGTE